LHKEGGKTDAGKEVSEGLTCAVVVCSDTISKGENKDTAGNTLV
jgi:molybdopterin biosynthesis enzyme MoaB